MTALSPIRVTLKQAREDAGLTQAELAKKAGIRQATISSIENRARRIDLDVLDRLCAVLKLEPGDLLERDGKRPRPR